MTTRRISANYVFPVVGEPIKNGYVDFDENGAVIGIGQLEGETESTEFYNGILCPGFTNAHRHIELSHLKDKFEEKTGMSGFINQINALRDSAPKEVRLALIEEQFEKLYAEGVTAMADISNCDESFDAKSRSKIYTRTFLEVFGAFPEEAEEVIAGVKELEAKAKAMGLDAAPTPHSPYTMSTRLLQMSAAEGLKDGFISYHNQESQEEEDLLISGTGALAENYKGRNMPTPPVTGKPALLYFINSLKEVHPEPFEESILLIHNTATNEESVDAALSTFKNVTWVTCPLSNIFIHDTLAPYDLLRSKGVRIAIGTDSLSSNHILSMAEEIKCLQQHHPEIPLTEILQWSCLNGAIALGKGDTFGSFEVGKRPGAVLIDHIDWKNFALTSKSKATRIL